jgi:hypothetical protein
MTHTDIIKAMNAMSTDTPITIGNCKITRGVGNHWTVETPRSTADEFRVSGLAAIVLSWL